MQSLNPAGLPPDSRRIVAMNCIISIGLENAECRDGEMQSTPTGTPRVTAISGTDLGAGQHAAMAGLGALAELELDHLDLILRRGGGEFVGAERAVAVAAGKIAGADFPDDVAAVFAMVRAIAALAGVVGEIAFLGAAVERQNGVAA